MLARNVLLFQGVGALSANAAGVGMRGIVLGLVCVAVLSAITVYSDLVIHGSVIALNALPIGVLTIFCVLVIVASTVLRRLRPRLAFTYHEVLTAYVMMLVAASLPSLGLTVPLLNLIPSARYFASSDYRWGQTFLQHIPNWIELSDREAVWSFYEGLPGHSRIPWALWLKPLAAWTVFAYLWFFAYFCLAILVRRQWVERERLTFPLAELPLEIVRGDQTPTARSPFFRSGLMWAGFAIPWAVHSVNSMSRYFPAWPHLQLTTIPIASGLVTPPWNQLQGTSATVYFSVIGLSFLISSQVALSSVVFWALARMESVALAMFGVTAVGNDDPTYYTVTWFYAHQEIGAILAVAAVSIWSLRSLLKRRPHAPDGLSGPAGLSTEQWAVLGFVVSFGLIGLWGVAAGVSFLWQIVFVGIYTVSAFSLVRLVAAGGFMWVDVDFSPVDPMLQLFSSSAFTPRDLTVFSYQGIFCWWNVGWSNIMQFATTGLRIATVARLNLRRVAVAMALACLLATVVGYWLAITLTYHGLVSRQTTGAASLLWGELPAIHFNKLVTMLQRPVPVQWKALGGIGLGFGTMWGLEMLSRRSFWFGLSPLGYLIGLSWVMDLMWLSVLVGWLANALVTHYLGLRGYRRLRPFFLGLILGEFLTAGQWLLIDGITGMQGHSVFPGW
ncbi:MAG: DUF6785 family protein [Armatimonadota bacterium]